MKARFALLLSAVFALCAPLASRAEDIDLFVSAPPQNGLPNVLIILDNTANWNQAFEVEMAALSNALKSIDPDKFNIGLMLSAETGTINNNISGGYVRAAIRPMTAANKSVYAKLFTSLDKLNDKGNGGASGVTMAEAWYYFSGGAPYAGNFKGKADYTGNTCVGCNLTATQALASNSVYGLPGNALSSVSATKYNSPVPDGSCAKNFIIYISNGPNQENSSADTLANTMLKGAGGDSTQKSISPTGSQTNPSDEWAAFMRQSKYAITTYTIDVNPPSGGQGPGWSRLLLSMANDDATAYTKVYTNDGGIALQEAIAKKLTLIQSVNDVFASVSLPVSVSRQGSYLNQVYVGMFRPDDKALPRWFGNLKQYRLGDDPSGNLRLQDADGSGAINTVTGFITECARSYWTPTTRDTEWAFHPSGGCLGTSDAETTAMKKSNTPDGNVVEKGGAGYLLRRATTRNVKTCANGFASGAAACIKLTDFAKGNAAITKELLGVADSTSRDTLIDWSSGLDTKDENSDTDVTQHRPSIHGDVVHSQPVAINFSTDPKVPKVVVFYGSNDGAFHAINGNREGADNAFSSTPAGGELWSFIPPEFYPNLKRLYDNGVLVNFPNVTDLSAKPKPYGIDGPVSADVTSTAVTIYAGMRRGGSALYAFGIDDLASPEKISLRWKQGCDSTGCSADFSDIGQTWAAPKPLHVNGYTGTLLVVGGGYDPCEDADPHTCSNPRGNEVYVLDAATGKVQATLPTTRGVIADVTIVRDLATQVAKYLYFADLGGNIYRVDVNSGAPATWKVVKIASLGCSAAETNCKDNRKFMFAPDVLEVDGAYVLLLGSGDREKPLLYASPKVANTVTNMFFMIKDKPADPTWLTDEKSRCNVEMLCIDSLTPISNDPKVAGPTQAELATTKGWALTLDSSEQVVTSAITIYGRVTFSTHQPSQPESGKCTSNLGKARVYNMMYNNGAAFSGTTRYSDLPSIGLPPSPVAGMVTLDNGKTEPFCIGCDPSSPLEAQRPPLPPSSVPKAPRRRVYWYIEH